MTAKVIPMPKNPASPIKINPPEGWKDDWSWGLLRGKNQDGHAVDLLSLEALRRWIQARQGLPRDEAEAVIAAAWPSSGIDLYWLQFDTWAHRMRGTPLTNENRAGVQCASQRQSELSELRAAFKSPDEPSARQRLAITCQLANELFGWGTATDDGKTVEAAGPAFDFSQDFLTLCGARKDKKGRAWTDDEKATLYAEMERLPKRDSAVTEAVAKALGLATAEAVRLKVREYKQAQDDARKLAANVMQVRNGKKVVNR